MTLPIWLCSVTIYLSEKKLFGLFAVSWLMTENKNSEIISHIVLNLKRDAQGNHHENNKNKKIQDAAIITLGYAVLSHGIYQWPPCLGFDPQLLHKSHTNKGQETKLPLWMTKTLPGCQTDHLDSDDNSVLGSKGKFCVQ